VNFEDHEVLDLLKYLRVAKDQTEELLAAMIDIEIYGEVDHDGMPVVNSLELQEDLEKMKNYIKRMEKELADNK
jgi:hypothetical protein